MRAIVATVLSMTVLLVTSAPASAEDPPVADKPAEASSEVAETPADADKIPLEAAAEEDEEFKIPPGFHVKKRGEFTLYCRKQTVMGTRFPVEKCYDETGIREFLRAQREDQQKVDQMRRICSSVGSCGST